MAEGLVTGDNIGDCVGTASSGTVVGEFSSGEDVPLLLLFLESFFPLPFPLDDWLPLPPLLDDFSSCPFPLDDLLPLPPLDDFSSRPFPLDDFFLPLPSLGNVSSNGGEVDFVLLLEVL